jgi:hypothetical protein
MTITAGPSEPEVEQSARDANITAGQGGVAAVNINQSSIYVTSQVPASQQSYADFIADFNAHASAGQYGIFWSGEDKHRKRSLNGDIEPAEAKEIIARRIQDGDSTHAQECADLLHSINRGRAMAILRLVDEDQARQVLVCMADGLDEFLADVSVLSASEAACLLYVAATDSQFRDTARKVFTSDAAARWRQTWINELDPSHAAFIFDLVGDPWPSELLDKMPVHQAALAIVSDKGNGQWLTVLKDQHRSDVLAEAARQDPDNLAVRLTQIPYAQASELVSVLSRAPGAFRTFTAKLSEWHLVTFAAGADLTPEQVKPLLPRLQATVKVWPWLAAFKAVHAVAPSLAIVPDYQSTWNWIRTLTRIWWLVRKAATKWTAELHEQRRRDVKIFIIGATTAWAVFMLAAIASTA